MLREKAMWWWVASRREHYFHLSLSTSSFKSLIIPNMNWHWKKQILWGCPHNLLKIFHVSEVKWEIYTESTEGKQRLKRTGASHDYRASDWHSSTTKTTEDIGSPTSPTEVMLACERHTRFIFDITSPTEKYVCRWWHHSVASVLKKNQTVRS